MTTDVSRAFLLRGLRWWAQGAPCDQAAVELLARSFAGRYLRPGVAWVRPCVRPGWYWLDADALADHAATLTGDEQRVLLLAAALVNGDPWIRRPAAKPGRAVA